MSRQPNTRTCLDCGAPLGGRRSAVRCRLHANRVKRGSFTPATAKAAAAAREARQRENARLADLARDAGLDEALCGAPH